MMTPQQRKYERGACLIGLAWALIMVAVPVIGRWIW